MNKVFLEKEWTYSNSKYLILPVPFEFTVSYGTGTKKGPDAILDASHQLENYDDELEIETINAGVHVLPAMNQSDDFENDIMQISSIVEKTIIDKKIPVVLGGEHSISLGVFNGVRACCDDFSVIHFDAHLDLRDEYEGTKNSHASVMKRIVDKGFLDIVSVGIRSVSKEEAVLVKKINHKTFYARDCIGNEYINQIDALLKKNIYISFDIDALDPMLVPATGTPEPGGLLWYQILDILRKVLSNRKLLALDLVELAPDGINHHSEFTTAKLLYKIMGYNQKFGSD